MGPAQRPGIFTGTAGQKPAPPSRSTPWTTNHKQVEDGAASHGFLDAGPGKGAPAQPRNLSSLSRGAFEPGRQKGNPFRGRPFFVGQPPKKKGNRIGATAQLRIRSLRFDSPHASFRMMELRLGIGIGTSKVLRGRRFGARVRDDQLV